MQQKSRSQLQTAFVLLFQRFIRNYILPVLPPEYRG